MPQYLTIGAIERSLFTRLGARMALVGFSTTPTDYAASPPVTNPATLDAITWAAELVRIPLATYGAPTDADLAGVTTGAAARVLVDLAELKLTEDVAGNWGQSIKISESVESRSITRSDHLKSMQDRIAQLREQYKAYLSPFVPGASIGRIHHVPITADPPHWFPGAGRRPFGPWGGRGGW
jgi:hypothetical protein